MPGCVADEIPLSEISCPKEMVAIATPKMLSTNFVVLMTVAYCFVNNLIILNENITGVCDCVLQC